MAIFSKIVCGIGFLWLSFLIYIIVADYFGFIPVCEEDQYFICHPSYEIKVSDKEYSCEELRELFKTTKDH